MTLGWFMVIALVGLAAIDCIFSDWGGPSDPFGDDPFYP